MTKISHSRRSFLRVLGAAGAGAPILARAERLEAALPPPLDPDGFDAANPVSVRRLRDSYFLSPDLVYLNHASIGTVPRPVHEAHAGYLELCETHPSLYVWGGVWREVTEDTRVAAARLLNCRPDDLAITHNTTEGFSILAQGLTGLTAHEALAVPDDFPQSIGLTRAVSPLRIAGMTGMLGRAKRQVRERMAARER